jgi:hypothetical protein
MNNKPALPCRFARAPDIEMAPCLIGGVFSQSDKLPFCGAPRIRKPVGKRQPAPQFSHIIRIRATQTVINHQNPGTRHYTNPSAPRATQRISPNTPRTPSRAPLYLPSQRIRGPTSSVRPVPKSISFFCVCGVASPARHWSPSPHSPRCKRARGSQRRWPPHQPISSTTAPTKPGGGSTGSQSSGLLNQLPHRGGGLSTPASTGEHSERPGVGRKFGNYP